MNNYDINKQSTIETIALNYHGTEQRDIHIENLCQQYEIEWLKKTLLFGSHVIDLGYGDGIISPSLAEHCKVTVVEGSEELCVRARAEMPENSTVVHELFENFHPQSQVDYVVASHVLEHVDDPVYLLDKISKWIKPNGALVVIVPNRESIHRRVARDLGMINDLDELSSRDHMVGHQRVYSLDKLVEHITQVGFRVEEYRGFFLKPLANSQMIDWDVGLLKALNEVSSQLKAELCANLAVVARI
jgi:2-polyprenyl-3-methyl-5-hydroxy-6-metoxy-1,4-benzoquinol methylase